MFFSWDSGKLDIIFKLNPTADRFPKLRTEMSNTGKSVILIATVLGAEDDSWKIECVCALTSDHWQITKTRNLEITECLNNQKTRANWRFEFSWVTLKYSWMCTKLKVNYGTGSSALCSVMTRGVGWGSGRELKRGGHISIHFNNNVYI